MLKEGLLLLGRSSRKLLVTSGLAMNNDGKSSYPSDATTGAFSLKTARKNVGNEGPASRLFHGPTARVVLYWVL